MAYRQLLNIILGTLVTTVGFWLLWGSTFPFVLVAWIITVGVLLWWQTKTITGVWAWSTMLLGLESIAWPVLLLIQLPSAPTGPSDEEMGTALSAVVLGLLSSVFWISFSYGLFKRAGNSASGALATTSSTSPQGHV